MRSKSLKTRLALLLVACSFSLPAQAVGPTIETIAGGGPDSLPALSSNIANPHGLAVDESGNLYIGTTYGLQHRVFRVDASGLLTVVAGHGSADSGGDGGLATEAGLNGPFGLAVDPSGPALYIADRYNHRVRRVDLDTGIIATVAGTGVAGFSGDNLPANQARLSEPTGIAVDGAGNLYIADFRNHRVRRVDAMTAVITTVAGDGVTFHTGDGGPATSAGFASINDVAADPAGNLFIVDTTSQRVRRVDAATGIIRTYAGTGVQGFGGDGGPATAALLSNPWGITLDHGGNLFIGETANRRVRRVDSATGIIATVAGNGGFGPSGDGGLAIDAALGDPRGLAVDGSDRLFITEFNFGHTVRGVDPVSGIIDVVAGNGTLSACGDVLPLLGACLGVMRDVELDSGRSIVYLAEQGNSRIRRIDMQSGLLTTLAGNGIEGFSGDSGPAADAMLNRPQGIARDRAGRVYVADTGNRRVRRVDAATGIIETVAGTGLGGVVTDGMPAADAPLGYIVDVETSAAGDLFLADQTGHKVYRIDAATGLIETAAGTGMQGYPNDGSSDTGPATAQNLNNPTGIALGAAGNLYIADDNSIILKVDANSGLLERVAGIREAGFSGDGGPATEARLRSPRDLVVDASGNLFIADTGNRRVRRVDASTGIIETVTGNGLAGFSGDGGPPTDAALSVVALAVDRWGTLVLSDSVNARVRAVFPVVPPPAQYTGTASPAVLCPPNHGLLPVSILIADENGNPPADLALERVQSSEPDDAPGIGDGRTTNDIRGAVLGAADTHVLLRAERSATGPGRTYTLFYTVVDEFGQESGVIIDVQVPHEPGDCLRVEGQFRSQGDRSELRRDNEVGRLPRLPEVTDR